MKASEAMVLDDILETIRRGEAGKKEADWLSLYLGLETTIKNPIIVKGAGDGQEQKISIEVLCTCRDGSCSSKLPKKG